MKGSCAGHCARTRVSNVSPSLDLCWNICVWHWFGVQLSLDVVWFDVHTGFRCFILGVDPTYSHCVRLWTANVHALTKKLLGLSSFSSLSLLSSLSSLSCDLKLSSLSFSVASPPLRLFLELCVPLPPPLA